MSDRGEGRISGWKKTGVLSKAILVLSILMFLCAFWSGPIQQPQGLEVAFVSVVMAGVFFIILCASARVAFSFMATGIFFLLISVTAYLKQTYLGNAFLVSDIYYLTGTHILTTIWKFPHIRVLMVVLPLLSLALLGMAWRYSWTPFHAGHRLRRAMVRVTGLAISIVLMGWVLLPHGPFSPMFQKSMWVAINQDAHLTSFFMSINALKVELPNVHNTPEQNARWNKLASGIVGDERKHDPTRPDIVVVLEESTFDPSTLPACDIPQCQNHGLIEPNAWTKASGPMISHVYGGGTALSEFDVLTGLNYGIFGLAGGYAPWSVAPRIRDSFPMQLRRLGYKTIAVYTVDGGYMNAREAYNDYGFDAFYDAPSLGLKAWGATDDEMFAAAKRVYEQERAKSNQPVFLMLKTIEQHGPHNNHPLATLPAPYNQGLFPNLSPEAQLNLSNYLARMDASDKAMEGLEKYFLGRSRPTIVMSFGDHKPNFSGVMNELKITPPDGYKGDPKYITYFKLDTNFSTPELPSFPATDIVYLPEFVLQAGSLPGNDYFAATEYLRGVCDGLSAECADKSTLYSYYAWLFSDHKVFQ
jgi:phosphoglycerol transferase MdoB-like AlkP superfamily enzyme